MACVTASFTALDSVRACLPVIVPSSLLRLSQGASSSSGRLCHRQCARKHCLASGFSGTRLDGTRLKRIRSSSKVFVVEARKKNIIEVEQDQSEGSDDEREKKGLDILEASDTSVWLEDLYQLDDGEDDIEENLCLDGVVKVYCTHSEPDYSLPWQKQRQFMSTGSGFVISGRRLLTNAHCVEHHTQVQVKKRGDDTKFVARVLAEGPDCDLALLTVDSEEFWEAVEPLKFGSLPRLQDPVIVVGYPMGGETISVTSGVVSRIEVTSYVHGASELLGVQIDAAINAGNSGGPAFNEEGECVGIAFQSLKDMDVENIGFVIPTAVIFHFLKDFEQNGRYTGFPSLAVWWQKLENSAMRASLKMKSGQKGVLIRRVEPLAPVASVVKAGDVLLSFDGVPIANEGTVSFRTGERIDFEFLVTQKFSGETAELELLRDGKELKVQTVFKPPVRLVPVHLASKMPSYFIVAGLVFVPLCFPYLESECDLGEAEVSGKLREIARNGMVEFEDQQVIVMSQVLAHPVNAGYENLQNVEVLTFNGEKIRNLRQFSRLVDSCTEEFMRFELERHILVVLETKSARLANEQILRDFHVPSERSLDLVEGHTPVTSHEINGRDALPGSIQPAAAA
ncbi:protease Do-like 2, chloroplastic [Selaginella moellendorffii]|uniref:protease Do-like 2, chloroplastic n=1 Tax=Selaginella moellendorffii TaxID=88036 RepID=UPI000D1CF4EC|nr:protease Do-like 2, chloroplastic [Selaginella moellendorffii]|eukprot:XP_024515363.1 protease Do-like 2, chloroplastic [Selaginella moellendorffii]